MTGILKIITTEARVTFFLYIRGWPPANDDYLQSETVGAFNCGITISSGLYRQKHFGLALLLLSFDLALQKQQFPFHIDKELSESNGDTNTHMAFPTVSILGVMGVLLICCFPLYSSSLVEGVSSCTCNYVILALLHRIWILGSSCMDGVIRGNCSPTWWGFLLLGLESVQLFAIASCQSCLFSVLDFDYPAWLSFCEIS